MWKNIFKETFEDTKEVFRSRCLWELSKELNISYNGPWYCVVCISYESVMKPSQVRTGFFLSEIAGPRWLELPIARTHFDSPFEFYCIYIYIFILYINKER
jgi:hypothetical protein